MEVNAIEIQNVCKTYGKVEAVTDLSFTVKKSHCFGLLGPNGAGKSTTMKMLYAKAKRNCGNINILGFDPSKNELEIKYISGIVPQDDNLDTELTVVQNLIIYSKFYGMEKKEALKKIDYLLDFMELKEKSNSTIRQLSGGMKRRLVIARALINSPQLLILDEPTTGLDPQVRHLIWDKIRMLKKEGVTIVLTTHYMEEAFQICDDLIMMNKGKKVLQGRPQELITSNIEKFVLEIINVDSFQSINIEESIIRKEASGNRVYLYSNQLIALEDLSKKLNTGDFYLRQSNLEDVFLKMTGRGLNE
ncbi:MAG: hypothetical protein A2086_10080 [Spirochaetes bacterium GWD1_27_9]|nr:MAG: hypothetical protein A2Z98_05525 [Spirochaetes bacterium GWB1_27_13]OHD23729.1 MAG: hypothetical protein A2Y34_17645 [Spirochaetes bacterium GWC1_27_15]OHD42277.1 MAG: hypothetical protein A2086_10080 [Spirochaetes bacterium GWD1_27_9]